MTLLRYCAAAALLLGALLPARAPAGDLDARIEPVVRQAIEPLMQRFGVPGLAVGIAAHGRRFLYSYGVASNETRAPVSPDTLFEIGSISKTFTATIAAEAVVAGRLSLEAPVTACLPDLAGTSFERVSALMLGTHTAGGLPLQVPDEIATPEAMTDWLRRWTPAFPPGTKRLYSNPSIGLLGACAAHALGTPFEAAEADLFRRLGLAHAFFDVPAAEAAHYAQGYTKSGTPVRMHPGLFAAEAYGVRTTASDLLRFVEANLGLLDLPADLAAAIAETHRGRFRIGPMTQDLVWEQFDYPADLTDLLAGNSAKVSYEPNAAARLDPPLPPRADRLIGKTGSTNGFAGYVAFVPARRIGIVLLANRNVPIEARVAAAHAILTRLDEAGPAR